MNLYYASQSFYPYIGGVSTSLLNLSKEMVNKGNRVIEVHLRPSGEASSEEIQGIEVHRVPREPIDQDLMQGYSHFKEAIYQESHGTARIFDRPAPEMAGFTEFNEVNRYLGEELRQMIEHDPADIVHVHDFQLLFTYQYVPRGTPLVLSWHIPFSPQMSKELRAFVIQYLSEYDQVVFSSPEYIRAAVAAGLPREKTELIPPLADTNLFKVMDIDPKAIRRQYRLPVNSQMILCVQRVDAKSGHEQLVRALPAVLKKVPKAILVFAGGASLSSQLSGERAMMEKKIRQLVKELELQAAVFFVGNVPYEKLPLLYNAADVVALCSKNEGFGLSVTEAMTCGKPIVGTRVGGIQLQIQNDKNGFLVEPGDHQATAHCLTRILQNRPLASVMGRESLKRVEEHFKLERGVEKHLILYNKVQRQKKPMHRLEYLELKNTQAIITDLDRTITDRPDAPQFNPKNYDAELLEALAELKINLILATGRNFEYVRKLIRHFSIWRCVVCENGAVLIFPRTGKTITISTPAMNRARQKIKALRLPKTVIGKVITSSRLQDQIRIKKALGPVTSELNFIRNVNEVMVTPKGVDKGQGIRLALQILHIDPDRTIIVGDGENDVDMFLNPGFKIALKNADPKLKTLANQIVSRPATRGIREIIKMLKA